MLQVVLSSSPTALVVLTLALLYYQKVLGYIVSFILKILIKGKIIRLNQTIKLEDKSSKISVKLESCKITSIDISPFAGIKGGKEERTFLLGLSLKHIEFKCKTQIIFQDKESGGIEVDTDVTFSLDAIHVNLLSFGLLLIGLRKLQTLLQIIRGEKIDDFEANGGGYLDRIPSNESELSIMSDLETERNHGPNRTPLYMLNKIIGRAEIVGLKMGFNAHFSSVQDFGREDEFKLKWSLKSNRITARMQTLKENGQTRLSVFIGGIKSRLKTSASSAAMSSASDLDYHSIQVKPVQLSMTMHSSAAGQTRVSMYVNKIKGTEGDVLDFMLSANQLSLLNNVIAEWLKPLLAFAKVYRGKKRSHRKCVERLEEEKEKAAPSLLDQVVIKLGASITLRDGSIQSTTSALHLSTYVALELNPSSSDCRNELPLAKLTLLGTRLKQTSDYDTDQVLDDLLTLDEFSLSSSKANAANATDKQDDNEVVISTILSFGVIKFRLDDAEKTERILAMILASHIAITSLLPKQSKAKNDEATRNVGQVERVKPLQDLSISCRSCVVHIAAFCQQKDSSSRSSVIVNANVTSFLIRISSDADRNQEFIITTKRTEAALKFTPHKTLPTYTACTNELHVGYETTSFEDDDAVVEFAALVSKYEMIILKSPSISIEEQNIVMQVMKIKAADLSLKEIIYSSGVKESFKMNEIIKTDGAIQVTIKDTNDNGMIFHLIDVQTLCPNLLLLWSPVLQWFISSAINRLQEAIRLHLTQRGNRTVDLPLETKKGTTKVFVKSNETCIKARAILGGSSVVDIVTDHVYVAVTNEPSDTWNKAAILFTSGRTALNLNEMDFDVAILESVRYFNGIRLASGSEIHSYCENRTNVINLEEEIVTGSCGTPLVEVVEINAKESVTIDFPPELHLGKVIEDINTTLRTMNDGLNKSKLSKPKVAKKRKYQLMDISLVIPVLDVHFLESEVRQKTVTRSIRFGKPNTTPYIDRWRFHIKGFDVKIQRNAPPDIVQSQIREMDEDKSRQYLYGPMIQGGNFHIQFDRVINTLHPLNLATPLGDITNWHIEGLIYLTSLSPDMSNLFDGKNCCVPLKCHHVNSMALASNDLPCRCDYAMNLYSRDIPVKIYYDLKLRSDQVYSTYGDILMPSIPGLMRVIERLIPKPPITDPRDTITQISLPPLDWWDNLRYQFHGKFQWTMTNMSFRWLLDTVPRYDWSILLTARNFVLSHSTGTATLAMEDVVISIPDSSYHMLDALPLNNGYKVLQKQIVNSKSGFSRKRHPLILFPKFRTQYDFKWGVSREDRNHSSMHHNVYMTDDLVIPPSEADKFEYFRSIGWSIIWDFKLDESEEHGTWIALRGDVLPWITHKSSRLRTQDSQGDDGPDALPKVNGIKIDVSVTPLNISAWFDEKADDEISENLEESQEGIFLQVPKFSYSRSRDNGQCFDLFGTVQAALLDIYRDHDSHLLLPAKQSRSDTSMEWSQRHHHRSFYEINAAHSLSIFESLEMSAKQIVSLDYLLRVSQIKIFDQALEDIKEHDLEGAFRRHSVGKGTSEHADAMDNEAPWTVLVAGMKLLWTVDIRDSVMSIVKDVLFSINFMTVNSRGTPQLLDAQLLEDVKNERSADDHDDDKHIETESTDIGVSDHSSIEIVAGETVEEACVLPIDSKPEEHAKPKSHLDYLLQRNKDSKRSMSSVGSPTRSPSIGTGIFNDSLRHVMGSSFDGSTNSIVPTFDLHLSNPQIQFHSAKTGGSVIIGIRGAYIEGKKFLYLLAKNEDYATDDFRLESLFRRTEFVYTLDRMQLFCASNTVDVDIGLQWLSLSDCRSTLNDERYTTVSRDWVFPTELDVFSTKDFIIPASGQVILQPITDPSTFKTRQEFHRPPIDLTKEELDLVIGQKLIKPLEADRNNALDSLEFFVDELSFHLNSYQFSTTLDVVRNTMLEPPKPRKERYYQKDCRQLDGKSLTGEEQFIEELIAQTIKRKAEANTLASEMKRLLKATNRNSKKWKEIARRIANELVAEVEDNKQSNNEPSIRRIEYNLCKAKWKIATADDASINDAEVNFTDFKGVHDFSADGQTYSYISLEDMHVTCHTPSADAKGFPDPTIIVKNVLCEKRSPCQRCGSDFDRNCNEVNSCRFHPGMFRNSRSDGSILWSCCGAGRADSIGCVGRPHTGSEKAMEIRFDAYPRLVGGLSLYKLIEVNIYPGAKHRTLVQLTRSTTKSFMNYLLGEANDLMRSSSQSLDGETESRGSSDSLDHRVSSQAITRSATDEFDAYNTQSRRYLLFGEATAKKETETITKSQNERKKTNSPKPEKKPSQTANEIVFVQNWNMGEININISVAGFHKFLEVKDLPFRVKEFQRRYKIGPIQYMVKKYVVHYAVNILRDSLGIFKQKLTGHAPIQDGNLESVGEDAEAEEDASDILLAQPKLAQKKKSKFPWKGKKK